MKFKDGDIVVCVDDQPFHYRGGGYTNWVKAGERYIIRGPHYSKWEGRNMVCCVREREPLAQWGGQTGYPEERFEKVS